MSAISLRAAAAQYPVEFVRTWETYEAKIRGMVQDAASKGANLLVFPEYASMELSSLFAPEVYGNLDRQLDAVQDLLPSYIDLHSRLAREEGVHILAGTFPVRLENGSFRNRACIFAPNGRWDFQEKLIMTRFENEEWKISPGTEIRVFDISPGAVEIRVGICICYDVEFPMIARKEVEAGATVILVPSCTDSRTGYHRVRLAAQARALENQCYVIQATTVGKALWSPALDENTGAAGVFSPVDFGFPEDGVLAAGYPDLPQWVYADLNLQMISEVRSTGQTLNHHDWEKQHPLLTRMVPEVRLTGRPE